MSKKIGALWESKSTNEKAPKYNGQIEVVNGLPQRIAVFKKEKKTENSPDYEIVLSPLPETKEPDKK